MLVGESLWQLQFLAIPRLGKPAGISPHAPWRQMLHLESPKKDFIPGSSTVLEIASLPSASLRFKGAWARASLADAS